MQKFSLILLSCFFVFFLNLTTVQGASITVTETADSFDDGKCSLRDAIQSVNTQANFGGCIFDGAFGTDDTVNLLDTTYVLSIGETLSGDPEDNSTGDLDVQRDIRILGQGSGGTIISGSGFPVGEEDRVIDFNGNLANGPGPLFSSLIMGVTIRDGMGNPSLGAGAGIRNNGASELNLDDVLVTENFTTFFGAGIFNTGNLLISNSVIFSNMGTSGDGGGIYNVGQLYLEYSTVDGNSVNGGGGGIANFQNAIIANSTISRNTATGNFSTTSIDAQSGFGDGGGILNSGNLLMVNSTVSNNTAEFRGGGIFTFSTGGGGANIPFGTKLYNVTIAQNQVIDALGVGGGVCAGCSTVPFITPSDEGSLVAISFEFWNTLVADNSGANDPDCSGDFISDGFNLIGNATGCNGFGPGTNDKLNVSAGIGPLQNNGGLTETHGLNPDSQAIDMGNNNPDCQAPNINDVIQSGVFTLENLTQDQRGFLRPVAVVDPNLPRCDIGAFEFQTFDFEVTKDDGLGESTVAVGEQFTYTITVTNNGPGEAADVTLNDPLPVGVSFVSATADQGDCTGSGNTVTCDLGDLPAGATVTVQIVVTAVAEGEYTNIVTISTNIKEFQAELQKTAQDDTTIQGSVFIFGSGCALGGLVAQGTGSFWALGFLGLLVGLGIRRRVR